MALSNKSSIEENVFINHLEEHIDQENVQSLSLANDIHTLYHRLNQFSVLESGFVKNLEEWRSEAHDIIDNFCQSKIDEYVTRTTQEIDRLRERVDSLSDDYDAAEEYIDWVKETIRSIHQQLEELRQISNKFSPLKIENSIIYLPPALDDLKHHPSSLKDLFSSASLTNELNSPSSPLSLTIISPENNSVFSFESPKETMKLLPDPWYSMATNETHLLIGEKSNLFLIDHSFKVVKKKSLAQIGIKDLCWSKVLSRFILISSKEIYLLDEKVMSLELCSIALINNHCWERGTCSETRLFLSTFGENAILVEYNLLPSIHFNKRYQSSSICGINQVINDMKSNENSLLLIIEDALNNETHLQLRSIRSFECIWSTQLGRGWGYRCSTIDTYRWIVSDCYNHRLIQISNNGTINKINNYSTKPFNVVQWSFDQIIIRTNQGFNVH